MDDAPVFDPLADGFFDDPYAQYARLREHDPVHVTPAGVPICFAYDDIRQLLIDPRTSMIPENAIPTSEHPARRDTEREPASLALLGRDPPDHTRLRRLMSKAFTPRRMNALTSWIQAEVDRLLTDVEHRWRDSGAPVDLIDDFAFPLPFQVISEILGMPEGDDQQIRTWAHDVTSATDPLMVTDDQRVASATAIRGITDYVTDQVLPWKRSNMGDDLLSELLVAWDKGAITSQRELLDQVTLLYMAGHETTVGLIGNAIYSLLRNRAQLERLESDPSLVPNAIDELNRYDSPVQFGWRITVDDVTVRDTKIPGHSMAFVCVGSANRDPAHFGDDADQLDVTRANAGELMSFGAGIHFCLGAALARREATLAVGELLRRFPGVDLAETPAWQHRITFRTLHHLEVTLA
jgi:cytochrome P450